MSCTKPIGRPSSSAMSSSRHGTSRTSSAGQSYQSAPRPPKAAATSGSSSTAPANRRRRPASAATQPSIKDMHASNELTRAGDGRAPDCTTTAVRRPSASPCQHVRQPSFRVLTQTTCSRIAVTTVSQSGRRTAPCTAHAVGFDHPLGHAASSQRSVGWCRCIQEEAGADHTRGVRPGAKRWASAAFARQPVQWPGARIRGRTRSARSAAVASMRCSITAPARWNPPRTRSVSTSG